MRKPTTKAFSRDEQAAMVRLWWEERRIAARADPNVFMSLCFRSDQEDAEGNPPTAFHQEPFHEEWQAIWRTARISVIHGATGFGKTEQKIGHYLWRLGKKPDTRLTLLGKRAENAAKLLRKIKLQIEQNKVLQEIFPELKPGHPWSDERLRLATAGIDTTTDTVEIYGMDGSPQGVRGDIIDVDDVLDFENTLTEYQRDKSTRFLDSVVQSRLTTRGQMHMTVNAWHEDDAAFRYAKRAERGAPIVYKRYPAIRDDGSLLWPSFRSRAWLDEKRATMTDDEFERMYLCRPRSNASRIFQAEWIARSRTNGAGLRPLRRVRHRIDRDGNLVSPTALPSLTLAMRDELAVVVGVDLATGEHARQQRGDFTVLFVLGVSLTTGERQVLWIERGRWGQPETLQRLVDLERRYQPALFVIEKNGYQVGIVQMLSNVRGFDDGRIVAFQTTSQKWHAKWGIEGIGTEMKAGRWKLPSPKGGDFAAYEASLDADEREAFANINRWAQHLLDFGRNQPHTEDDVMASYLAKEGARSLAGGTFEHSHEDEMAPQPASAVLRRAASDEATTRALMPAEVDEDVPVPPWMAGIYNAHSAER